MNFLFWVALTSLAPWVAAFAPSVTGPSSALHRRQQKQNLQQLHSTAIDTTFMWNAGLNFGKGPFKFYNGFDDYLQPFPDEDRAAYPEVFNMPEGLTEVILDKPLGIIFEEIEIGKGLYVQDLVEGGNADLYSSIQVGDVLVGITATKIVGAKYERRLIPARSFDFDTMVGAVQSNDRKWGCDNVIMMFERPSVVGDKTAKIDEFMSFFQPPFDNPWRQRQ